MSVWTVSTVDFSFLLKETLSLLNQAVNPRMEPDSVKHIEEIKVRCAKAEGYLRAWQNLEEAGIFNASQKAGLIANLREAARGLDSPQAVGLDCQRRIELFLEDTITAFM